MSSGIAIVGIACRFPGANNPDEYWSTLRNGSVSVSQFSDQELIAEGIDARTLQQPNYVKANGIIANADMFDAGFFGYNAYDATMMDPQHRFFLECAWEAIENAGYNAEKMPGIVGVYAGAGMNTYLVRNIVPHLGRLEALEQFQLMISSDKDYIATRLSFKLNFTGPSVNVQTSCSTSLVAMHLACQSLNNADCDIALAGGVAIRPPLVSGYAYREGMIYSPDGYCRAFDARAGGTVNSNGVGVLMLRRLSDALADGDHIHAVIKGSAINNDGSSKRSYSAPSSAGQAEVIAKAIERAGIEADRISYVEAHGTGTILGDPIEVEGLTQAFRRTTAKTEFCALGSVKTNIGHTDVAAGMAGLLKVVQMLKHQEIVPSLNFETPNPRIDFAQTPFFVNTALRRWESDGMPRQAGVSSFGVGGTNAHAVLEEAPIRSSSGESREHQLLIVSARSEAALNNAISNLENYLNAAPTLSLADASYTLQVGRKAFEQRAVTVAGGASARDEYQWFRGKKPVLHELPVAFMFSGQGAQYVNMGRDLYRTERVFREQIDWCAEYLLPLLGFDLRTILYHPPGQEAETTEQLTQTSIAQVALFVIEYALSHLWMDWGIQPAAMVGHSIGEYVAACLAGVFSLEDALKIVVERGRLMQAQPGGSMLAVSLSEQEMQEILRASQAQFEISLVNSPTTCVVSGRSEDIGTLEQELLSRGTACRRLQTSHAFHSFLIADAVEPFVDLMRGFALKPPKKPYLSNVSGTWITEEEALDPAYYGRHLRQTVRFSQNIAELARTNPVLLEVGPGQTLATLARRHPELGDSPVLTSTRHPNEERSDQEFILTALGKLWVAGANVDWARLHRDEQRQRIPLPTYPFEHQRYWIDELAAGNSGDGISKALHIAEMMHPASSPGAASGANGGASGADELILNIWRETLGIAAIAPQDNFFDLGGDSLVAAGLLAQVQRATGIQIPLVNFFQSPTPASLVKLLQDQGWQSNGASSSIHRASGPLTSMIQIQSGSPLRRPFFWAHGTDFANFARILDREQPFYVMPPPGLDGRHPIYSKAEDIVAYHIDQMKIVQPGGPYIVAGYCLGGHLALNIAAELLRRGEDVSLVVLVDVTAPDYDRIAQQTRRDYLERFVYHLRYGQLPSRVVGKVKDIVNKRKVSLLGSEELRLLQQLDDIQQKAFEFRIPEGYPGRVVAFTCATYDARKPQDSDARWTRLAPKGVEHYVIPGDHSTLMREPNIDQLVAVLNRVLREEGEMAAHPETPVG